MGLRELIGLVGAHEWRKKGVEVPALGRRPPTASTRTTACSRRCAASTSTWSPGRPLPADVSLAWDIGTGTGVIAAVLARRGIARVVATDLNPRALACARDNIQRLHLQDRIELVEADLFPAGTAPLIVCNPPWLPGKPSSMLEQAVYDPDSRMLRGFLGGLRERLAPGGEGWLVLSDLAEHLGLRTRGELLALFDAGGLVVLERLDVLPRHPKASDANDPLAAGAQPRSHLALASRGSLTAGSKSRLRSRTVPGVCRCRCFLLKTDLECTLCGRRDIALGCTHSYSRARLKASTRSRSRFDKTSKRLL